LRPAPAPSSTPSASPSSDFLFGLSDYSVTQKLATAAQSMDLQKRLGANAQRISVDWRWVEPSKDRYNWAKYDVLYSAALARGIRPVFMLLFAPSWTLDGQCDQFQTDCTYPPTRAHLDDWREFVELFARRYPRMAGVEVWNEPNMSWFWKPGPDPNLYMDLVREARAAVKSVDPGIPVAGGSIANTGTTNSTQMSLVDFTRAIYREGAKSSLDAVSIHPYPNSLDTGRITRNLDQVRGVLREFGDTGKPLWVTEIGLSSKGSGSSFAVTEKEQADGLVAIYRTLRQQPDVTVALFHTLVEPISKWYANPADPRDQTVGFGVLRQDLTPKPAFCALAAVRGAPGCS
jgi:endo-1,4-beta-mannosidase